MCALAVWCYGAMSLCCFIAIGDFLCFCPLVSVFCPDFVRILVRLSGGHFFFVDCIL